MGVLAITLLIIVGIIATSYVVEAFRAKPSEPKSLEWCPEAAIRHADLDGVRVRYVKMGRGPDLVLLHTLRTQLDIWEKVAPQLAQHFTVYAIDYPGHGWSDIPNVAYTPENFYSWVEQFIEAVDVRDVVLAGISIGGTIALELAARGNPRISRVVSINPYDYADGIGTGLGGSSLFAGIMTTAIAIPVVGGVFMRLRNPFVERHIFNGGVADPKAIPDKLFSALTRAGDRPGFYQAFTSVLRNRNKWQRARSDYGRITMPILLVYGDEDWAPESARAQTAGLIPNVQRETVVGGGHFLSLDRPDDTARLIVSFAKA